ncbi:MAG TPA: hypothetical protein VE222_09720, partial [Nitrospiraceae bacterium]|nr:hypothetical protein [Nitrospiraceae bacterium]
DLPLTAAVRTMEVAGDRIDTPPFSDGQEAAEAWVGKEVVFIVGYVLRLLQLAVTEEVSSKTAERIVRGG